MACFKDFNKQINCCLQKNLKTKPTTENLNISHEKQIATPEVIRQLD